MAATKVAAAKVVPLNCVAPEQVLALKEPTKGERRGVGTAPTGASSIWYNECILWADLGSHY